MQYRNSRINKETAAVVLIIAIMIIIINAIIETIK
jgi:hypothetical protein